MSKRQEILEQSIASRSADIELYQINIDNYRCAISDIEKNHPDMNEFAEQLRALLKSALYEQKKEQIMLSALIENRGSL